MCTTVAPQQGVDVYICATHVTTDTRHRFIATGFRRCFRLSIPETTELFALVLVNLSALWSWNPEDLTGTILSITLTVFDDLFESFGFYDCFDRVVWAVLASILLLDSTPHIEGNCLLEGPKSHFSAVPYHDGPVSRPERVLFELTSFGGFFISWC